MRQILVIFGIVGLLVLATVGTCGWSTTRMMMGVLEDKTQLFAQNYPVVRWCGRGLPFVDKLYSILDNKTYIVLLQNNTELRASGGFMGSFVKVQFENGGLKEFLVQDIYQPDGQLPGHVEPPYPVQEAFGQGWWKLRDANWDPDFEKAGETITWFMEQGGVAPVDGVIAVNLELVKKWLEVLGEVESVTYGEKVTTDNIYSLAQRYAEENWKPGSTQKRDFLGAVGVAMFERTKFAKPGELLSLGKLIWEELRSGQIMVWFRDKEVQKTAEQRGWTGKLGRKADDYIYVVESNLGANKANCCIERSLELHGIEGSGEISMRVDMQWKNSNPYENPKPPESWGGNYFDYVRVVLVKEAEVLGVQVKGKKLSLATQEDFKGPNSLRQGRSENIYIVEEKGEFKTVGFWAAVPAGEIVEVEVNYKRKWTGGRWGVQVVRQPGITGWPISVTGGKREIFKGFMSERERIFTIF